jgi:hypothetical protein
MALWYVRISDESTIKISIKNRSCLSLKQLPKINKQNNHWGRQDARCKMQDEELPLFFANVTGFGMPDC